MSNPTLPTSPPNHTKICVVYPYRLIRKPNKLSLLCCVFRVLLPPLRGGVDGTVVTFASVGESAADDARKRT